MLYETLKRAVPIRPMSIDWSILRPYFSVFSNVHRNSLSGKNVKDSRGPLTYLLLLIFPFNHNLWTFYQPDLFVPINGLMSYLLVKGILLGHSRVTWESGFHKNINQYDKNQIKYNMYINDWSVLFSKVIIISIILIFFYKTISFFLDLQLSLIELAIISFHKYFYLTIGCLLIRLLAHNSFYSKMIYFPFILYFYTTIFLFMARAYKLVLHGCGIRRISLYFLIGMVLCEMVSVYCLL